MLEQFFSRQPHISGNGATVTVILSERYCCIFERSTIIHLNPSVSRRSLCIILTYIQFLYYYSQDL